MTALTRKLIAILNRMVLVNSEERLRTMKLTQKLNLSAYFMLLYSGVALKT